MWNENIKSLWEIKNQKQRLYNSHKTLYTAIELRKSNNRLKKVIREAKKAIWENYLSSVAKGIPTKQIWGKINKIRKTKQHNTDLFEKRCNVIEFMSLHFKSSEPKPDRSRVRPEIEVLFKFEDIKDY